MVTQDQIDAAYLRGKRAWWHNYGTHGPTCCMRPYKRTDNPEMLPHLIEAWNRGYYQDARRLTPRSILTAVYGEQA